MIKTITLTGNEVEVSGLTGTHAHLRNDGTSTIYAAKTAGITPGADGAGSVPAGKAYTLRGISGTIFLLGTGSVHIQSDDIADSPFESSAASGGSGADEVARAAIGAHEADTEIHVTAADKEKWNGLSNPNLLINPDFRINQRGETSYSDGYTVDRWRVNNGKVEVGSGYITLEAQDALTVASLRQTMENSSGLAGKTVTFSVDWDILNAGSRCCLQLKYNNEWSQQVFFTETGRNINAVTVQLPAELTTAVEATIMIHTPVDAGVVGKVKLYSAKLEIGGYATSFCPPNPAVELEKCQRYYQIRSTNDIAAVDLRPTMRTTPTDIKAVTGGYAYVAEF